MLDTGGAFFLLIPDESKNRILHPAKVVCLEGNTYTAELEEEDLDIAADRDAFIFYEAGREFLQQAAHILFLKILGAELKPTIEFETTGEPSSAENRQYYRVSTVTADLVAGLGDEDRCPLVDLSCVGFSVIARRNHAIGSIAEAALFHEGEEYRGEVSIQSARELTEGCIRYGLHCVEQTGTVGNMSRGLWQMAVALQSEQLRRLAATDMVA